MMAAMAQRESKLVRPRMLLALSLGLLALAGCRNRNASGPAYPSLDELARCEEGECVETSLTFRHWADAGYYRGRIPYHCTPGSELDGPQNPAVTRMILGIHGVISDVNGYVDVNAAPGLNHVRYVDQALLRAQRSDPSLKRESIAIIAPTFQRTQLWQPYTDEDKRYWTWASADYKFGADSAENRGFAGAVRAEPVSAFDVLDEFLRAALITFPNLEQIVIVGHSAGGQTVHRYALLGLQTRLGGQGSLGARRRRRVIAGPRDALAAGQLFLQPRELGLALLQLRQTAVIGVVSGDADGHGSVSSGCCGRPRRRGQARLMARSRWGPSRVAIALDQPRVTSSRVSKTDCATCRTLAAAW